jgi:hypothetical protein
MKHLKKYESYQEPIFLAHVRKPVEIRINIEAIEHVLDRMARHGYQTKVSTSGYKSQIPNITKDDIKSTIEKGIEELTIALMQDRFSIYDGDGNFSRFVFRDLDSYLHVVCEFEPGDQNFSLVVVTVMKDINFRIGRDQFVIVVSERGNKSGFWNPTNSEVEL